MCEIRERKINNIVDDIPSLEVEGDKSGKLLVVCWGSTYGAVRTAFDKLKNSDKKFSFVHLRYMNPLPKNLGDIIDKFKCILIPEINRGQLKMILQSKFLRKIEGLHKMQGIPFKSSEIENKVLELLNNKG